MIIGASMSEPHTSQLDLEYDRRSDNTLFNGTNTCRPIIISHVLQWRLLRQAIQQGIASHNSVQDVNKEVRTLS